MTKSKQKFKTIDGLPLRIFSIGVKFNSGDKKGQHIKYEYVGHEGSWFEKLAWLIANDDMSMPQYDILFKTSSEPLTEDDEFVGTKITLMAENELGGTPNE